MNNLYRISTKKTDVWGNKTPKPIYFVCRDKEAARKYAEENLAEGLSVSKITKLAKQVGTYVFTAI
jgi:hypothetical protein